MGKRALAVTIGAVAVVAGSAQGQSFTFDLSNYVLGPTQVTFGTHDVVDAGVFVTGVEWNITYQGGAAVGSASWANEISLELSGPTGSPNTVSSSGFAGGFYVGTPANAGTFIWGDTANPWIGGTAPHNPGGDPNSYGWTWEGNATYVGTSTGTTSALDGDGATGTWALRIFDSFGDTVGGVPLQGMFGEGSHITVHYIPTPGAFAVLGMAGVFVARRRRA